MGGRFAKLSQDPRPQWLATAHRLRMVRLACAFFVDRWTSDRLAADARAVERMAADLRALEAAIADPNNHDWSLLYRGSVLDD
ncbi:MAG: hypothetical protein ABR964_05285 [Tepidisphaeraceae bacterium]|jgi:hypothetical protein